jgi:ribosome-binding factor A
MTSPTWYNDRIAEELNRKISSVIAHKLRDPRIPPVVTVTGLNLSPDKRNATVHVSVYATEAVAEEALVALNRAAPFVQRVVAESMRIRRFPRLCFKLDTSLEYSQRINELLEEVKDDLDHV